MVVSARGIVPFVAAVLVASASAQTLPGSRPVGAPGGLPTPATGAVTRSTGSVGRLALEGPVDANAYLVGPGDIFTVAIGGSVPRQFTVTVSADGRLVIPEAGSFVVAGRTLARVRGEVQGALQQRFQNVTADVALSSPREFYVHVSGRVPEPGRHLVSAVARVEEAVVAASGTPIYALASYGAVVDEREERWPALRSVRVEGRGGAVATVDLMRYLATGVLADNPYLNDGDRVHLPSFDPTVEGVVVQGAVDRPGTYDVRPDDTARALIEVTSGPDASARIASVRRVRAGEPSVEVPFAEAARLDVRPRDQIYAVAAVPDAARALISGAVRYPGLYPIEAGRTTLNELVAMAGGLREDALPRAAHLERSLEVLEAGLGRALTADMALPDVSVDADLLEGLFGRQFYARQTSSTPRVAIDPERALRGEVAVPLYEGDHFIVPFDYGLVRVYGRVERSGYVPYVEGATAGEYVAGVGGSTATAALTYVVDAATGQLVEGAGTVVRAGDAVFVNSLPSPDTPELATLALQERADLRDDIRERRQSRYQFIQTVLSVTGTVASLVLAYVTFQSVNN